MSYYRRVTFGGGGGIPQTVKNLLIVNVVVFVIQAFSGYRIVYYLGLVPKLVWGHLFFWQWFTYMFLHGGIWHIALNMYVLWMFGSEIERMWGSRAFLNYYLITGVGAGIFYSLVQFNSQVPTIGASGAIYAILVAFAVLFPHRQIALIFPPIVMQARTMVLIFLGIELFNGITGSQDGIAHVAHLGGALVGYLYMKRGSRLSLPDLNERFNQWNSRRKQKANWKRQAELNRLRQIVDEILDKANDVGIENLSKEEQDLLKKASKILKREE